MIIQKKELESILKLIFPAADASNRGQNIGTDCVFFENNMIFTYKDSVSICVPFKSDISGSVPITEFSKFLTKVKSEEITIQQNDKTLHISSGNTKAGINMVSANDKIKRSVPSDDIEWNALPIDFIESINMCSFSISKNDLYPHLNNIYFCKNYAISSDNFRISRYLFSEEIKTPFLLPESSIKAILGVPSIKQYAIDDTWIYLKSDDDVIISIRKTTENYPDTFLMYFDMQGYSFEFPDSIKNVIDTCIIFTENDLTLQKIEISIIKNIMQCKGENYKGWASDEIELDFISEKDIKFSINPIFLKNILAYTNKAQYCQDKFIAFSSEKFQHTIACMVKK